MAFRMGAGAETGDTAELEATDNNVSATSAEAASGGYSYRLTCVNAPSRSNNGFTLKFAPEMPEAWARLRFKLTRNGTPGYTVEENILTWQAQDNWSRVHGRIVYNATGAPEIYMTDVENTSRPRTALEWDRWYLLELYAKTGNGDGAATLRLDGTVIAQDDAMPAMGTVNWARIRCRGAPNDSNVTANDYEAFIDDIALRDDDWAGPGRIIARQGKSGTPSDDFFDKNGGADIHEVWSDTPFSVAKNASSAVASAAQTMFAAPVSDVIGAEDIINFVKLCFVGSTSSTAGGGGDGNYRYYLGSGGHNVGVGIDTADKLYQTHLAGLTRDQVDTMQIGYQKGGTSQIHTIHDVWVMVDYEAADEPPPEPPNIEWESVDVGAAPDDGTGDPLRTAFQKINANFDDLFGAVMSGAGTPVGTVTPARIGVMYMDTSARAWWISTDTTSAGWKKITS